VCEDLEKLQHAKPKQNEYLNTDINSKTNQFTNTFTNSNVVQKKEVNSKQLKENELKVKK